MHMSAGAHGNQEMIAKASEDVVTGGCNLPHMGASY